GKETTSGIYDHPLNYNPITSGTPLLSFSADLNLSSIGESACGWAIGLGGLGPNGEEITFGLISVATAGFSFLANEQNTVIGQSYTLGEWVNVGAGGGFG